MHEEYCKGTRSSTERSPFGKKLLPVYSNGQGGAGGLWAVFSDILAGGVAGFAADSVVHPIDTVKARLQFQQGSNLKYRGMLHAFTTIIKEEGVRKGLYTGVDAVLLGSVPSHAITFGVYHLVKRTTEPRLKSTELLPLVDLAAGALSEVAALSTYVPAEVAAKRMQTAKLGFSREYVSALHAFRMIVRTEGIRGLYVGFLPTMLRDVPFTSLQFAFFEQVKILWRSFAHRSSLNNTETYVSGSFAGGLAAALTNPFDVVKTRMQTQPVGNDRKYKSLVHCFCQIMKEEGFLAFFKGVVPRVVWIAPASGITLGVFEGLVSILDKERSQESEAERRVRNNLSNNAMCKQTAVIDG
ncbi:Probable S-adenosylmethionine carrier 2, chloroplastic [Galdieria sulphuraria]|uniref:Mitochondrial carrier (BOU / S-adenosylmethionine carrier) n=1 Tax=Galdieria sulphuraria TaxID=130081 RepID=M2Y715_GALSU|nr:mitochondrial carrier (BOU / S-adenosylmethionine carrier) [Galdieria sulphuraria]EME31823.1 mitochondrial carrier (BOU / S-adenosylmethionine carrier) [Galdieria sulphuraria]GJD10326.1 Probable S-adenosylmethionine carrier 2, chloroplastic [Galdieria sulphuraria]|eukprot:XP_005708343.1 mitochondrial carrier (BOU / S-adenosylmethionine carrier) [Galdieria sulphuraria]